MIPASAQKGLAAKVTGDQKLLPVSRLTELTAYFLDAPQPLSESPESDSPANGPTWAANA